MKRFIIAAAALIAAGCSMKEDSVTNPNLSNKGTVKDTVITKTDSLGNIIKDTLKVIVDSNGVIIDTVVTDKGVVITSERTEIIKFDTDGKAVLSITGIDTISANDIRAEIDKENMSLDLFTVTNVKIKGLAEYAAFAEANKNLKMVTTISYMLPGGTPEVALMTVPEANEYYSLSTIGDVQTGLIMNKGLFAKSGALKSFEAKVKDKSVSDIIFIVEIKFFDPIAVPEDFKLSCTIEASSKKKI